MKSHMKAISLALLGAFAVPAFAITDAEVEEMQSQIKRMQVKLEALEEGRTTAGLEGFKISGVMDPTFVYNKRRDSAGFNFLSNFTDTDGDGNQTYAYDNSYFGQVMVQFDKELESGTKWKLTLVPHKSASSGYNLNSVVHEATVSIPLSNLQTRLIAGQYADWTGYEYYFGHQNKLITHNLLFDFTLPSFYQGAGIEMVDGKWLMKGLVANMNKVSHGEQQKNPIVTYRVDYSKGEYDGFGFTGQHGKVDDQRIDMMEFDAYFVRGDWSLYGQASYGKWKNNATNGADAIWSGASVYAGYKVTPRFELIARADFIKNEKNGGGTFGAAAGTCSVLERDADGVLTGTTDADGAGVRTDVACAEGRNGFGPGMQRASDSGEWEPINGDKGVNRSAVALGANYVFNTSTNLKFEYRIDQASAPAFFDVKTGNYEKTNTIIGASVVVSF